MTRKQRKAVLAHTYHILSFTEVNNSENCDGRDGATHAKGTTTGSAARIHADKNAREKAPWVIFNIKSIVNELRQNSQRTKFDATRVRRIS